MDCEHLHVTEPVLQLHVCQSLLEDLLKTLAPTSGAIVWDGPESLRS